MDIQATECQDRQERIRESRRKAMAKYRENHPEKTKEYRQQYYAKNREKILSYNKQYNREKKDSLRERAIEHRKENPLSYARTMAKYWANRVQKLEKEYEDKKD